MAYVHGNPKTKKALKEAVAAGGVTVFNPGLGTCPENGTVYLEGPQYPAPHNWYATAEVKDGIVVKVR